ncbi:hypothetical protein GCM10010129_82710 [Streptomyces fumigatiscleroticus]|nr:hypothetical protein GCM10010129_82710 [Streptomyces fumigatiscleroticus]
MERVDGPHGQGVVDDLFIAGLLPRAGVVGHTDESVAGGSAIEASGSSQITGLGGCPAGSLRENGPPLDQDIEELPDEGASPRFGHMSRTKGSRWHQSGSSTHEHTAGTGSVMAAWNP